MSIIVPVMLRAPSKRAGRDCCFVLWDSVLLAGAGCIRGGLYPGIGKPDTDYPMTWCKRMSRANHSPSFGAELKNKVCNGI